MKTLKCSTIQWILTWEFFYVHPLKSRCICLGCPMHEMCVSKLDIRATTEVAWNPCTEWLLIPAKCFYLLINRFLYGFNAAFPHPHSYANHFTYNCLNLLVSTRLYIIDLAKVRRKLQWEEKKFIGHTLLLVRFDCMKNFPFLK